MKYNFVEASEDTLYHLLTMMKEFYFLEHLNFNGEKLTAGLRLLFDNKSFGRVYLIKCEEDFAGYAVLTFGFSLEFYGRDALVDEIFVREHFRGKGIGSRLLNYIEQVCGEENIYAVHLEVDRINTKAQELYRRMGYKDHNRYLLTKWLRR